MSSPTSPSRRSSRARTSSSRRVWRNGARCSGAMVVLRRSRYSSNPPTNRLLGLGAVGATCGLLLYRLAPDVGGKPLYEDEAVAGLIGARPAGELLDTVLFDRGGAPLHFLLAHVVFSFEPSADALRWLSVVCAVAAVPVTFDLGR